MTETWSNPKPDLVDCPCGCLLVGRPRVKAWADGLDPHVRACKCRRCSGRRHKARAGIRERKIAKDTGGARSVLSGALNGYDGRAGNDVWEETSNQAVTLGFFKWWRTKVVQEKVERINALSGVRAHLILHDIETGQRMVVTVYEPWTDLIQDANQ